MRMKNLLVLLSVLLACQGYAQDSVSSKEYSRALARIDSLRGALDSSVLYGTLSKADPDPSRLQSPASYSSLPDYDRGDRALTIMTAFAVLVFGLFLIALILIFLIKSNKGFNSLAFKLLGIILVLTLSLFLVIIGYDIQKISFLIVLIGIITGFILGAKVNPPKKRDFESD